MLEFSSKFEVFIGKLETHFKYLKIQRNSENKFCVQFSLSNIENTQTSFHHNLELQTTNEKV